MCPWFQPSCFLRIHELSIFQCFMALLASQVQYICEFCHFGMWPVWIPSLRLRGGMGDEQLEKLISSYGEEVTGLRLFFGFLHFPTRYLFRCLVCLSEIGETSMSTHSHPQKCRIAGVRRNGGCLDPFVGRLHYHQERALGFLPLRCQVGSLGTLPSPNGLAARRGESEIARTVAMDHRNDVRPVLFWRLGERLQSPKDGAMF